MSELGNIFSRTEEQAHELMRRATRMYQYLRSAQGFLEPCVGLLVSFESSQPASLTMGIFHAQSAIFEGFKSVDIVITNLNNAFHKIAEAKQHARQRNVSAVIAAYG